MGKQSSTRRNVVRRGLATCIAASLVALLVTACDRGRGADDPSSQQGQGPQAPGAMPGAMPNGPNTGMPSGGMPGQPGAQPGQPAQAASPLALPCQNDSHLRHPQVQHADGALLVPLRDQHRLSGWLQLQHRARPGGALRARRRDAVVRGSRAGWRPRPSRTNLAFVDGPSEQRERNASSRHPTPSS